MFIKYLRWKWNKYKKITEQTIKFLENIILLKETPNYFSQITNKKSYYEKYQDIENEKLILSIEILNDTNYKFINTTNPKILLELALIKIMQTLKKIIVQILTKVI